jgi:hypothetical protein
LLNLINFFEKFLKKLYEWGFGDWGLGIGDWGLGPIPNPQSPIPNKMDFNLLLFLILK